MSLIDDVDGVKEHMESTSVQMVIIIRRIEAGLMQSEDVGIISDVSITQDTISKIECGDKSVSIKS